MKSAPGLHWFIKFILPSASYEDIFLLRNNPNSGVYLTRSCSCEDALSAFVVFSPQPSLGSRQVLEVLDMFATPYCFCLLCWNCISQSKLVAHIYCFLSVHIKMILSALLVLGGLYLLLSSLSPRYNCKLATFHYGANQLNY